MKKTYLVEYTCHNCKEKLEKQIKFGETIPILVPDRGNNPYAMIGTEEAPECSFCGCRYWSYGKAKK